ncbi:MAG: tandem-95 repeat protein [Deltaproteobacteria bacterium]|nr:tandem-95 repeat protein [Deltaproteobacteria bacterium]
MARGLVPWAVLVFLSPSAHAQLSLTDATPQAVDFSAFTGQGFSPAPAPGQLDSDTWRVTTTGWGATMEFGDTPAGAEFARGLSLGGASTDIGVYAFDVNGDGSKIVLGGYPANEVAGIGQFWLKVTNDSTQVIDSLTVDFTWWTNNIGDAYTRGEFWHSATTTGPLTPLTTFGTTGPDTFSSPGTADALGWRTTDFAGDPGARSLLLEGLSIQPGESYYLQWHITAGFGAPADPGDEIGFTDVVVTASFRADPASIADSSVRSFSFAGFRGHGYAPQPNAGQLDSDMWIVQGVSGGTMTYGDTEGSPSTLGLTSFGRHDSFGGVVDGGVYAFDTGAVETALGGQPTDDDLTEGGWVLRIENDSTQIISELALTYTWYVYNDGDRQTALQLWHSPSPTAGLVDVGAAGSLTTPETADAAPAWAATPKTPTITGLAIQPGEFYYLHWRTDDVLGTGDRDEVAFGLVTLAATLVDCVAAADCDDGDACNGAESCAAGACQAGTAPDCDDSEPCTADSCVPASGCAHADICDFGDAPDPTYPTLLASDGARHIVGALLLGPTVDADPDGQPNATATGDDLAGDDEDGITFSGAPRAGQPLGVTVISTGVGKVDAWVDLNANGSFADAGEKLLSGASVVPGATPLVLSIPLGATAGATFARFRLSTAGGLASTGLANDGEVEDYALTIAEPWDFGDAPDTFKTLLASDGARHTATGVRLGATRDGESDGVPGAAANGDGADEDGVAFTALKRGRSATITLTPSAAGKISGWVDWNRNGAFDEPSERVATDLTATPGSQQIALTVPAGASLGASHARFRISTQAGLGPAGAATDGEVEDYAVTIVDPAADLSVVVDDDPDPVVAGETVTYTMTVSNAGPDAAFTTVASLAVPPDATFVPGSSSGGCALAGAFVNCSLGTVDTVTPASADVTFLIAASHPAAVALNTSATVSAATNDPDGTTGSGPITTNVVRVSDMGVSVGDSVDPVSAGQTVDYTVSVTNGGPSDAASVVATFKPPGGATTVTTVPPGCVFAAVPGRYECAVGTVVAGGSASRVFTVSVPAATANGTALIVQATVASDSTEGGPGDESDSEGTTVQTGADLATTITPDVALTLPGGTIVYTVHVSNSGPSNASAATVKVTLGAQLVYDSDTGGCTFGAGGYNCALGTLSSPTGSASFTLTAHAGPGANGTVTATAVASSSTPDPSLVNNTKVATVPVNQPPVAVDDSLPATEDTPKNFTAANLLANDSDPDDTPTVASVGAPSVGAIVDNGGGSYTYNPPQHFNGNVTFTYTITDGRGGTAQATVTLVVAKVNDPPVAVADNGGNTNEDTAITLTAATLLANDTDPDLADAVPDVLSVLSAQAPQHGTVVKNPNGSVTFTPTLNYHGPASFTYTIEDLAHVTSTATVNLTVVAQNDPPVAVDDAGDTYQGTPVDILVLGNDSDVDTAVDGDDLIVSSVTQPAGGTVIISADQKKVTFQRTGLFFGVTSFLYTVSDQKGGTDQATVTVTVRACGDGVRTDSDGEHCDDGGTAALDGCSSTCTLETGYTCSGVAPTACVATCGTAHTFASTGEDFVVSGGAPGAFSYGASAFGGGPGFETALGSNLPASAVDTRIARRVKIPTVADAPQPRLTVRYKLSGDGSADCMRVYVTPTADISAATPLVQTCVPTPTVTDLPIDVSASAGQIRYVTIRFVTNASNNAFPGLYVGGVTVGSDVDDDGLRELQTQAGCDPCIDVDEDGFGSALSVVPSSCPNGASVDCNDDLAAIRPDAAEICTGAVDDDCDGQTDLVDSECQEDCADGVDDNSDGNTDCADLTCAADAFCQPCSTDWTFEHGPATWFTDNGASDLWQYVPASGEWRTAGTGQVASFPNPASGTPGGVYVARLHVLTSVPAAAVGGPKPTLSVTYRHAGDANPGTDKLMVCINQPTCRFSTVGAVTLASTPGAFTTGTVDLTAYAGQDIQVTILYDTVDAADNANDGARITRVALASDVDQDGQLEGADPSCDPCWDADGDGYGDPRSPDPSQCSLGGDDCRDDASIGFFVNPGAAEDKAIPGVCADAIDNDCNGQTDGGDPGCGSEDCANGVDDNGDLAADCADAQCAGDLFCGACGKTFTFASGGGGWVPEGPLFETGFNTARAARGWETVLNGNVDTAGTGQLRGWLRRTVDIPTGLLAPEITITYLLAGQPTTTKDIFGVCFDTANANCDAAHPENQQFSTGQNTPTIHPLVENAASGYDRLHLPVPTSAVGGPLTVVIFYDTVDGTANANAGLFIERVAVQSDVDRDGLSESSGGSCDHCVDVDQDGFGDATRPAPFNDLSQCAQSEADCLDTDPVTHPAQPEVCGAGGGTADNNCNGLGDLEEPLCSVCGDGVIGAGESCDDGDIVPGDGCSADCALESGALHLTELHLPKPNGNAAEQWIEIYNASTGAVDVGLLGLQVTNLFGVSVDVSDPADCTILTGTEVPAGGFFVIAFGPELGADNVLPDATCSSDLQLSLTNERVTLSDGGGSLIDVVDLRAGFGCELAQTDTDGVGRSLMLIDQPVAGVPFGSKSSGAAWCLAGPAQDYSNSGKHRGTPHAFGPCAEFACDGVDDDCDGQTDQDLTDTDHDDVCDAQDCEPNDQRCSTDCSDLDEDNVPDCRDGCIDKDQDGYGTTSPLLPPGEATCLDVDCDDSRDFVHPDAVEGAADGATCGDGLDNDCDGHLDCSDGPCATAAVCDAEICERAAPIACGETVVLAPTQDDFACGSAGGRDGVLRFTPDLSETVTITVTNQGTGRYSASVLGSSCTTGSCAGVTSSIATGCSSGGVGTLAVTGGQDVFLVLDAVGACAEGPGTDVAVKVTCGEICGSGIDEDQDGLTDCDDPQCVTSLACVDADFDSDGATNGDEVLCGTNALDFDDEPTADQVADPDHDDDINCVDGDDDGDGLADVDEAALCPLDPNAKNDATIHPGAAKNCSNPAVIDADCNGVPDLAEDACGGKEVKCGNAVDDDTDGLLDCFDPDCIAASACRFQDFDADMVGNGFEIDCGSDPLNPNDTPAPGQADDVDQDDKPNCVDTDDDGDFFSDVQELICGSDPLDGTKVPLDTDNDTQCDAIDTDDDDDGYNDTLEATCGSSGVDATETPVDAAHDLDGDGICDPLDGDVDGDDWTNSLEELCGTDASNPASNPTDSGLDVDGDGVCDALDTDDDGDGWSDADENLCGTDPNDPLDLPPDLDDNGQCDVLDQDSDGDGWSNAAESLCGTDPAVFESNPTVFGQDLDDDLICDAVDSDDDGDDWLDAIEVQCNTNPADVNSVPVDTDLDGQCDAVDGDDDDDGWLDGTELLCGTDPLDAADTPVDLDGDGLCDAIDPDGDPDDDGWSTAAELFCGTDPKDPQSTPGDVDSDLICDSRDPDIDGDGWDNALEPPCGADPMDPLSTPVDTDGDSICDANDQDDDGDGSPDTQELACNTDPKDKLSKPLEIDLVDTDGDGLSNCVDEDDDDDGLSDAAEASLGSNPRVKDSDADGLEDGEEDANHDGVTQSNETSPIKPDTDGDGLDDLFEATSCYPVPEGDCEPTLGWLSDTDTDGLQDGAEDANHNGIVDPGETNPVLANSDGDLSFDGTPADDGFEVGCKTNPLDPKSAPVDRNVDGICDGSQVDSDGDGVPDGVENFCGFDPKSNESTPSFADLADLDGDGAINCADADDDNDGFVDLDELACGTDPRNEDSAPDADGVADFDGDDLLNCADPDDDGDGLSDVAELADGTDPRDADSDDDGLPDGQEASLGTDPNNRDTDGDGVADGTEFGLTTPTADTDLGIFQPDLDPSTTTDPKDPDDDGDGLCDGPQSVRSICEPGEDLNANGRVDEGETNPLDPSDGLVDTDGDGLSDRLERELGTDPRLPDTDGDGLTDLQEVEGVLSFAPTDPLDPDTDAGGVPDGIEVDNGTDPNEPGDDFSVADVRGENFVGCGAAGGQDLGLAVVLLALLAMALLRRRGATLALLLGLGASLATAGDARAQATGSFNAGSFSPAGGHHRVWSVQETQVTPAWKPYGSLIYHLETDSLTVTAGRYTERVLNLSHVLDLNVGVGLFGRAQVELSMPVALAADSSSGTSSVTPLSGAAIGDLLLRGRVRLLDNALGGLGVAVSAGISAPTGDEAAFRGDPGVGILLDAIVDWRTSRTVVSLNLGAHVRTKEAKFLTASIQHELTYGLGLEVFLARDRLSVASELFGHTPVDAVFQSDSTSSLEAMFGPKWWFLPSLSAQAAASLGLVRGVGTPSFRFMLGVQWAPRSEDLDGDGIADGVDRCVREPEDLDGFADMDGCPDLDNDQDGMPDELDNCPNRAEDFNGVDDEDGCPEGEGGAPDHDGDGIPDAVDRCPTDPETYNGYLDLDGCPDEAPLPD